MQSPAEFWPTLKREVVTAWSSGQRQEAFIHLGGVAKAFTPTDGGAPPDAPPRWLTDDVDDAPWGGPANVGWLMTAFAILGGALGLRADQLDLALTRAMRACARAGTTPRAFAVDFEHTTGGRRIDPLRELLFGRVRGTLRELDAPRAEAALSALLALYPDAVGDTSWLALEMAAMDAVSARMHARDEATATALTHALSLAIDAQPDAVRRGATGLLALRGSLQVWRAEARFGGPQHDEAMRAIEIAAAAYDALPGFVDLPRAQIPLLRGHDAQRAKRPEDAARHFADALVYLVERYRSASPLLTPCIDALAVAAAATADPGALDAAGEALTRARRALRERDERWAVDGLNRTTLALARVVSAWVQADRGAEVRALLNALHGQLGEPCLVGDAAATACAMVGQIHFMLREHAAACGCYDVALAHLGGARFSDEGLYLTIAREYAMALARSRNLGGLERMLRDERSAFGEAGVGATEASRRWVDAMRATVEAEARRVDAQSAAARELAARLWRIADDLGGGGPASEGVEALADAWLAPISRESPAGVSATQDRRYDRVVAAIAQLDSPTTSDGDRARVWGEVIQYGSALLRETSKDLTIAAYVAHAMCRKEGGRGLVRGLALLVGLVERYWDVMFPELKRAKRRANALSWYVERTSDALDQGYASADRREFIDQALALVERLSGATRERLGDAAPRFGPLRESLQRRAVDLAEAPR